MRRRVRWRRAAVAGLVVLLAVFPLLAAGAIGTGGAAGTGEAIGTGGADPFGLNPAPLPDGRAESYFNLAADTGQSATATVILSDLGRKTEKLKLSPLTGRHRRPTGESATPGRPGPARARPAGWPVWRGR